MKGSYRILLLFHVWLLWFFSVCEATMITHDPTSYGMLTGLLNSTKQAYTTMKETKNSLDTMKGMIGEVMTIDEQFIGAFNDMISRDTAFFQGLESSLTGLAFDGMSVPQRSFHQVYDYLNDHLHIYAQAVPTLLDQPVILAARNKVLQQACLKGMTLGVIETQMVQQSIEHIQDISRQGLGATNLLAVSKSNTELLTLVAKELVEIKAILAAQLELQSSISIQGHGFPESKGYR